VASDQLSVTTVCKNIFYKHFAASRGFSITRELLVLPASIFPLVVITGTRSLIQSQVSSPWRQSCVRNSSSGSIMLTSWLRWWTVAKIRNC